MPQKIFTWLAAADIVLVLWSKAAADSQWVLAEIRDAVMARKLIIPIILETDTPALPSVIAEREWTSFATNAKDALARLKHQILTHADAKWRREQAEATARKWWLLGLGSFATVALCQAALADEEDDE